MTVICNATPLINFAAINRLDILQDLFGQILIPKAVYEETTVSGFAGSEFVVKAVNSGWLQIRIVSNIPATISPELDDGEREAIALSLETSIHKILLDEKNARQVAQNLGLQLIGTLGILLLAKNQQIITQIKPLLDAMINNSRYWVSDTLYEQVLQKAGE